MGSLYAILDREGCRASCFLHDVFDEMEVRTVMTAYDILMLLFTAIGLWIAFKSIPRDK